MYHILSKMLKNIEPNPALHFLKELEKEKHIKPQISSRKKIECRNIEKINETKSCVFEMENNRDKLLTEKAMAPHSSTLAWKIPWTEKPGRLQSQRVRHD